MPGGAIDSYSVREPYGLVAGIIPGCRLFEKRWERFADTDAEREELAPLFVRDVAVLWIAAIGLPFLVTGVIKVMLQFF